MTKLFVAVDSDGTVFDTMELKHKECFCPATIKYWGLQGASRYVRETAEYVNLYSIHRGINRWPALAMTFDLLRERPEVVRRGVEIPKSDWIHDFVRSSYVKSNWGLQDYSDRCKIADITTAMHWSASIDIAIFETVHNIHTFHRVNELLQKMQQLGRVAVVSTTPASAVVSEWKEAGIYQYCHELYGQESGSKAEILQGTINGERGLFIGDTPSDMRVALAAGMRFFPIMPGYEDDSWEELYKTGIDRFVDNRFDDTYQNALLEEFSSTLLTAPTWRV